MGWYFLIIRIAAFFGHEKARKMVRGQRQITVSGERLTVNGKEVPKGAIWFHAASVGEFEQARPIIEKLKIINYKLKIVVTFFSPSGYEMRKNYDQADAVLYLPFATKKNAKEFIEALQPKMAIFVKYEFWPAYLKELKRREIPTYSICSIFREKQYLFQWWARPMIKVLDCFTHLFVQDEASKDLLAAHGITQVSVTGDTRFDRMIAVSGERLRVTGERLIPIEEFAAGSERVIVAGSTWPGDEELLAEYIERVNELRNERTKLILVPHEIDQEHLHWIFNCFRGRLVKYSSVVKNEGVNELTNEGRRNILKQADVLVVDAMGLLSAIYPYGQVAYIGGGFGVGIHNTIEAAAYGKPVLFGPNYDHFREAKGLIAAGAARSVANYEELESALDTALEHYIEMGAKAAEYVQSELGATDSIYHAIFENCKL